MRRFNSPSLNRPNLTLPAQDWESFIDCFVGSLDFGIGCELVALSDDPPSKQRSNAASWDAGP